MGEIQFGLEATTTLQQYQASPKLGNDRLPIHETQRTIRSFQDCMMKWWGEGSPQEVGTGLFTNGCSISWAAVGRSLGLTCKHLRIKSRASLDTESGIGGSSPLPILNNACICQHKIKQYLNTISKLMPAFINHKMFNMNKHAYKTWKIGEIKSIWI